MLSFQRGTAAPGSKDEQELQRDFRQDLWRRQDRSTGRTGEYLMRGYPLLLADANRAEQFLLLGRSHRLLAGYSTYTDADGVVWAVKPVSGHGFAVTWLGAGWAFDPTGKERRAEELQKKREAMLV